MIQTLQGHVAGMSARVQSLSHARLSSYRTFFNASDDAQALGIHEWNDDLSACLFRVVRKVELVLRNQLHKAFSVRYGSGTSRGSGDWYTHVTLSALSMERIKDITHYRQGARRVPRVPSPSPDDVVARLNFGFWRHLLEITQDARLQPIDWGAILMDVLPGHRQRQASHWNKRKHRDALFARLSLCNELRNRIAHHEPIWKFGPLFSEDRPRPGKTVRQEAPAPSTPQEALARLALVYDRLTELLGWLAPEVATHHAASSLDQRCRSLMRAESISAYQHARRPATIDFTGMANLRVLRKALRHASRRQQPMVLRDGHRALGHLSCPVLHP